MTTFEIKKDFILNGQSIQLISGAVHYFRIVPEYWQDRLEKLKNMGCNCVETYIPWNFHEVKQGQFDFSGRKDLAKFVRLAQNLGLWVILRPTPYICSEWEFGGLPFWLLKDDSMRVRSTYKPFLEAIDAYYEELFKVIRPLFYTNGGPVLMCQIENEYGSFGNDKKYLKAIKDLMIKHGCDIPLFTSDGGWREVLDAGTLLDEDVLPTANFGSRTNEQIGELYKFMQDHHLEKPLMCMEFWIGWFNNYGSPLKTREANEASYELDCMLKQGSINIYMFHGGTNFGFYNGCSYHHGIDPQITSYDYAAPLTEWGSEASEYQPFKEVIQKYHQIETVELSTKIEYHRYGELTCQRKVSLFNTLDKLAKPIHHDITLSMEKLDQGYGYILYHADLGKKRTLAKSKLVDCDDRAQVFINHQLIATQYKETMGENIPLFLDQDDHNTIDILVENLGRINYGASLVSPTLRKGLKGGFMLDLHFHSGWDHYCLDFENIDQVDFDLGYEENVPAFYEFSFVAEELKDTFIHLDHWGKGCAFINGFNLGRFWEIGPTQYLYLPAPLLKKG
ncbi:MAG: beta-galactosidase family protein, partial [Traorella sp.]